MRRFFCPHSWTFNILIWWDPKQTQYFVWPTISHTNPTVSRHRSRFSCILSEPRGSSCLVSRGISHLENAGLTLDQRLRRWFSVEPAFRPWCFPVVCSQRGYNFTSGSHDMVSGSETLFWRSSCLSTAFQIAALYHNWQKMRQMFALHYFVWSFVFKVKIKRIANSRPS